jgi:hypothetical protein
VLASPFRTVELLPVALFPFPFKITDREPEATDAGKVLAR